MFISSIALFLIFALLGFFFACPFLLKYEKQRIGFGDLILCSFSGWILLVILSVFFRLMHIPEWVTFLLPVPNIYFFGNKISRKIVVRYNWKIFLIHFSIFGLVNINLAIQAFRMGSGDYPTEFYNVDSAAYMSLLHGYAKSNSYPPINLGVQEGFINYHFGSIAFAALISKFNFIKLHTSLFIGVVGCSAIALYTSIFKISQFLLINKNKLAFVATFFVMMIMSFQIDSIIPYRMYNNIFKVERYGKDFPMISSYLAITISIVSIYWLLHTQNMKQFLLPIFMLAVLPFFKLPFAPTILFVIGAYYCLLGIKDKAMWYFRGLFILFVLSLTITILFSFEKNFSSLISRGTNHVSFIFQKQNLIVFCSQYLVILLPICISLIYLRRRILLLIIITAITSIGGSTIISIDNPDYLQMYPHLFSIALVLIVPLALEAAQYSLSGIKLMLYLNLALPSFLIIVSSFYYTYLLKKNKSETCEYANNNSIAKALSSIPINSTLVITNDLRYPSNNYRRDDNQLQISAIFGHQTLASSRYFVTKSAEPNYIVGLTIKRMLQQSLWNDSLGNLIRTKKVTHILIHKYYSHPDFIPFPKIYESLDYEVYKVNKT